MPFHHTTPEHILSEGVNLAPPLTVAGRMIKAENALAVAQRHLAVIHEEGRELLEHCAQYLRIGRVILSNRLFEALLQEK